MLIANPIYDVVFKYLLEDNKIAKLIIGKIIGEEVIELIPKPQERIFKVGGYNALTVYHLDFSAVIKTNEGEKKVIIEIQKAKFAADIMRFRRYIGSQYSDDDNTYEVDGKKKALPIISIYFINYALENIDSSIIKVSRNYIDLATNEIIHEKNEFVESLTHDAYVIQIQKLRGKRRNDLEVLLSIFDQDNRFSDFHILKVNEENFPEEYRPIIRRLQKAQEERQVRDTMDAEDLIIAELQANEREVDKIKQIAEKAIADAKAEAKAEKERAIAEVEAEREKAIAEANADKERAVVEAKKLSEQLEEKERMIRELLGKTNPDQAIDTKS